MSKKELNFLFCFWSTLAAINVFQFRWYMDIWALEAHNTFFALIEKWTLTSTKNFLFYPIHMTQKTFHDPVLEGKRFIGGGNSIPELKTSFSYLIIFKVDYKLCRKPWKIIRNLIIVYLHKVKFNLSLPGALVIPFRNIYPIFHPKRPFLSLHK